MVPYLDAKFMYSSIAFNGPMLFFSGRLSLYKVHRYIMRQNAPSTAPLAARKSAMCAEVDPQHRA
ncbi:MAG TPA: hypothetical protein DD465_16830 [Thalassospira sp.]|nr:hypothetical protein [Thalassospira sp.]